VGKPPAVTQTLDELVMLLQASLSIANTERWALEQGEEPPPQALAGLLRTSAYEVTVVDHFHRLARRHFESRSYRAVWERPFHTGTQGRPPSVDVSLFRAEEGTETRIELGLYTKAKVNSDAAKLHQLREISLPGYGTVRNLIALWDVKSTRLTAAEGTKAMKRFKRDAAAISTNAFTVNPLLASAVDLFVVEPAAHRYAVIGLFEIQ
jgi:hypothetical protein